jgi:predicted ester cyclase
MPASELPISFRQMAIYRIVNGRIAEMWEESDGLGLWQQIGVIPSDLTR